VGRLELPDGFRIRVFARVPDARSLSVAPDGTVFVGNRDGNAIHVLRDRDQDGWAEVAKRLIGGLDTPNGVAFKDGALYVAEISRVLRFDRVLERLDDPPAPVVVANGLPNDRHHGWKFIRFGPDGRLFVPVGAPCNVCLRPDPRYASILRMRADGSGFEVFASGVRNTVGFDWHPTTGELWFTDNGRDWMGDDVPPDELNRAGRAGLHFGFPFCHGGDVPDPEFGGQRPCSEFEPPVQRLGPHVAALGMRFYTGTMFPESFRHQVFIAEHGSWNRSTKIGYRVSLVRLAGARATSYETFIDGWLEGDQAWGRPVDVAVWTDGSLLVSDDKAGAVYRVTWDATEQ
jgi:glucose/arabinose dehydrogenase